MNILWHSSPAFQHSGYAIQSREFIKRLQKDGHRVVLVPASKSFDLPNMNWEGIQHLPGGYSRWGLDGVYEWSKRLNIDLVITLFDVWDFPEQFGHDLKALGVDWMPIVPIDAEPLTRRMLPVLKTASYPTAMSKFGLEQMRHVGVKADYFPHGVDTKTFVPAMVDKKNYGFEKMFVVGCVANNIEPHDRKGLVQTVEAFGKFHKKHPNSIFLFHGDPSQGKGGVDMIGLAEKHGFTINSTEWWLEYAGLKPSELAELYNVMDVYMLLSGGEGFGIPYIEAQACDVPVIATDFSAQGDLVGAGWKVPVAYKRWTLMSTYWAVADVDKAVDALEQAHKLWLDKNLKTGKARRFAEDFDFDRVYQTYCVPIIKKIEKAREQRNSKTPKDL